MPIEASAPAVLAERGMKAGWPARRTACICTRGKKVTYADIEQVLHSSKTFDEVESAFAEVQKITHCSTGCGGCHDEIMDTSSEIMHQ